MNLDQRKGKRGPKPGKSFYIEQAIHEGISNGHYQQDSFLPSENTLAAVFAANRKTVQKALRNLAEEGAISSEPRRGWRVIAGEKLFAGSRILYYEGDTPQGRRISSTLNQALNEHGFTLQTNAKEVTASNILADRFNSPLRGVFWYGGCAVNESVLKTCSKNGIIPIGIMESSAEAYDTVCCDHYNGMLQMLQRLYDMGKRRVAFIASDWLERTWDVSFFKKRAAYLQFTKAAGIEPLILEINGHHENRYHDASMILQWLKSEKCRDLEAIFCVELPIVTRLLTALQSEGICAGDRYTITTCSYHTHGCLLDLHHIHSMLTVHVPAQKLALAAAGRMLFRLRYGMQTPPCCTLIKSEILDLCTHRDENSGMCFFE